MENYSILVPSYTVGPEAYKKIPDYCGVYGRTAVVIGGEKAMAAAKDKLLAAVAGSQIVKGLDRLGADLAGRHVDNTRQAHSIAGIADDPEIGDHITDLGAVGEPVAGDNAVRNTVFLEGIFNAVGQSVVSVKDCKAI